jgi:hypothetical protein
VSSSWPRKLTQRCNFLKSDRFLLIRVRRWTQLLSSEKWRLIVEKETNMKCKFCFLCKYYNKESKICNNDDSAWKSCNAYSEFEVIIAMKQRYNELPEIGP